MLFDFLRRAARNAVLAGVNDAIAEINEALPSEQELNSECEAPLVEERVKLLIARPK